MISKGTHIRVSWELGLGGGQGGRVRGMRLQKILPDESGTVIFRIPVNFPHYYFLCRYYYYLKRVNFGKENVRNLDDIRVSW